MQKNLAARVVLGGISSVAGGGKFGNGAITAAFGYLYNDIAVIYGKQKPGSPNIFGHIALAIEGFWIFSFGNSTELGSSTTKYFEEQVQFRDNTVVIIQTTLAQDIAALLYLLDFTDKNGVGWCDNCANHTAEALSRAGINAGGLVGTCPLPAQTCAAAQSARGARTYEVPQGSTQLPNLKKFNP